jgi:HEPN domain-containing protein
LSTKKPLENIVKEWLALADDDLQSAKELAGTHWRQTCFLCQQAVEKYLKALLILRQIPFERTHNTETLVELLEDAKALDLLRPDIADLSDYAVDSRYPGYEADLLDKNDADQALATAFHVKQSIHKVLNL